MDITSIILIVAIIGAGIMLFVPEKKDNPLSRLEEFSGQKKDEKNKTQSAMKTIEDEELQKSFFERIIKPVLTGMANLLSKRSKTDTASQLKKELAQAGNPGGLTATEFSILKVILIVVPAPVFAGLCTVFGVPIKVLGMGSLIIFVLCFLGPRIYLQRLVEGRKYSIQKGLPDCLDLLCVSVEAGLGFDIALSKLVTKFKGAIAEELKIVLSEMQMGRTRKEALKSMADKMDVPDLSAFVSAIVQADQLGVSVSKVLKIQSAQARLKKRQRAEEMAMQAPVKMLFPMVGCIFPTIMVVLLGGVVFEFIKNFPS